MAGAAGLLGVVEEGDPAAVVVLAAADDGRTATTAAGGAGKGLSSPMRALLSGALASGWAGADDPTAAPPSSQWRRLLESLSLATSRGPPCLPRLL